MVCAGASTLIDEASGRLTPVGYTVTKPMSPEPSIATFSTAAVAPLGMLGRARVKASPALSRRGKPCPMRVSRIL